MSEIQFVKKNQGTEYGGNPDQAGASAAGKAPGKKRRKKMVCTDRRLNRRRGRGGRGGNLSAVEHGELRQG